MKTYFEKCKDYILDVIDDYVEYDHQISDLGMDLTEVQNIDGSWYCSTYKAKKDLSEWLENGDDIENFISDYELNYGSKPRVDGLTEPEQFHNLMMIVGIGKVFNTLEAVFNNWDSNLTKKIANEIKEELNNVYDFD